MTRLTASILAVMLACVVAGCNAKSVAQHHDVRTVTIGEKGSVTVEFVSEGGSVSIAPGPTSQPTIATSEIGSVTAIASGQQTKPLEAYGVEHRDTLIFTFAAGFLGIAILGLMKRQWMLVAGGAMGAIVMLGAKAINAALMTVLPIVFLIGAGLAAWYLIKAFYNRRENLAGVPDVIDELERGNVEAAKAALKQMPVVRHVLKEKARRAKTA